MSERELAQELERRIEELGYELVELERAGSARRPILRMRIDRPDGPPRGAVTTDDCSRVSRALEAWLDERPGVSPTYVLEVSSPGVERPLVRERDFERFRGEEVALLGKAPLAGRAARLEGELLGLVADADGVQRVRIRLAGGEEVEVPRAELTKANLVFRWGGARRPS